MGQVERTTAQAPWIDANEIKRHVSIESVLSRYGALTNLKKRGSQLSGHSPFREDKHPSFSVNLDRGIWNDGAGRPVVDGREVAGNVIGLVQAFEKCSFRDALLKLQESFAAPADPQAAFATEARGRVQEELRLEAATPPENQPFGRELGGLRADVPFLKERGLSIETINKFGVGYCSRGLMKGRIVFPIRNREGAIMAYAGRTLKENDPAKYRFPSGFSKSRELFNIERVANESETMKAVKDFGLIVVEGFMDVLRLYENGFTNAVALMGTDLHDEQKAMLIDPTLNPTRRITLFLDNDEAGIVGTLKLFEELAYDAFVRVVDYRRVPKGMFFNNPSEPEHFTRAELVTLLSGLRLVSA